MRSRSRATWWALAGLGALAAACGGTSPAVPPRALDLNGAATPAAAGPGGGTGPGTAAGALSPSGPDQGGGAAPGGPSGGAGPGQAAPGAPAGPATAAAGTASSSGPTAQPFPAGGTSAASKSTITVGYYYDVPPASGAISGVAGSVIIDGGQAGQTLTDYINAHGGVGGHRLAFSGFGAILGTDQTTDDQAACTKFRRDVSVPIVLNVSPTTPAFYQCIISAGIPLFDSNYGTPTQATYMQYGNLLFSGLVSEDRLGVTLASELGRDGYFRDPGGKFAMLYEDYPWFQVGAQAFAQAAAARGVRMAAVDPICPPAGCDNSQLQNEVIKLRAAGVNHVAFLGITTSGFIQQAAAQAYFPRYGLTSENGPEIVSLNEPGQALAGAVGVGYFPGLDVGQGQQPAPNPRQALCNQLLFGGRSAPDPVASAQANGICEAFFALKDVLDRNGGITGAGAIRSAFEALGSSHVPNETFSSSFGPRKHDGAASYRALSYDGGCSCFRYSAQAFPMSLLPGQ